MLVPYAGGTAEHDIRWDDLVSEPADLSFEHVPADHPLYVFNSSGTTGLPKPIVHGHGGILLEHHKVLALHGPQFDVATLQHPDPTLRVCGARIRSRTWTTMSGVSWSAKRT